MSKKTLWQQMLAKLFETQRQPRAKTLEEFHFVATMQAGIYGCEIEEETRELLIDLWKKQRNVMENAMLKAEMTYEEVRAEGEVSLKLIASTMPKEQFMPRFTLEERLEGLKAQEVLEQFEPEQRLAGLEPEVIEAYLKSLKAE